MHRRDDRTTWLGAGGADLLVLSGREDAPRVRGTTGLYHFAILVPTRGDLAGALRRLIATNTRMQGAADHGVSEALYLADPDGNGIEIYRDRPRAEWPYAGAQLRMGADPLDLDELLAEPAEAGDSAALAAGTVIGHVHLHVSRLDEAERFYVGVLGFSLTQRYGPSALFVSRRLPSSRRAQHVAGVGAAAAARRDRPAPFRRAAATAAAVEEWPPAWPRPACPLKRWTADYSCGPCGQCLKFGI